MLCSLLSWNMSSLCEEIPPVLCIRWLFVLDPGRHSTLGFLSYLPLLMVYFSLWLKTTSNGWRLSLWLYSNKPTPLAHVGCCPSISWLHRISVFLNYWKPHHFLCLWQEMLSFACNLVFISKINCNLFSVNLFRLWFLFLQVLQPFLHVNQILPANSDSM